MVTNRVFGHIMDEGDNPSFFKILRREDLSSEIMRGIPLNFIKSISEKELSAKMVLKVSWGNSWPIKISRNSSFYYMEKNGWERFLSDNALGNNEFLTFTHKGHMCFSVDIYQIDSMEMLRPRKSATIASSSCRRNQREQSKNIYADVKTEELESSSSESSQPGAKTAKSEGRRPRISLRFKNPEEIEKAKKMKKTKVETICSDDSEAETSSLVPGFTISIKKSYLKFLGIPKNFDIHMPKEPTMFTIHHPNGKKSWKVMYVINGTQSRFSAGWIRLAKDLDLVIGDVCTLKLIKPTEMLLKVSREGVISV